MDPFLPHISTISHSNTPIQILKRQNIPLTDNGHNQSDQTSDFISNLDYKSLLQTQVSKNYSLQTPSCYSQFESSTDMEIEPNELRKTQSASISDQTFDNLAFYFKGNPLHLTKSISANTNYNNYTELDDSKQDIKGKSISKRMNLIKYSNFNLYN